MECLAPSSPFCPAVFLLQTHHTSSPLENEVMEAKQPSTSTQSHVAQLKTKSLSFVSFGYRFHFLLITKNTKLDVTIFVCFEVHFSFAGMETVFSTLAFLISSREVKSDLFKLLDSIKHNVTEDLSQIRLDRCNLTQTLILQMKKLRPREVK